MSTYYRWFEISEEPFLNDVLIQAGKTLSMRFKEKGEYLRSFVSDDSLFIDIMMNVGIVFYAALETSDEEILDIAMRHCLTTRRVLVRGDGSTAHEGVFDLETGEFLKQTTHQGYRGDSCWTRGLAWALYGFGTCHQAALRRGILMLPKRAANRWIPRLPRLPLPVCFNFPS
jgi:unsaturated chondroitin disaccharide hydrolase